MTKKYKKDFLSRVIFRLDFFDNVPISSLDDYAKMISESFSDKEEKEGRSGFLEFNFESGEVKNASQKMTSWVFHNKNASKKLEVNVKYLYLEYNQYSNSEELVSDIEKVVMPFVNKYNISIVNRIGLRYINEIPDLDGGVGGQLDWENYINPELLGGLKFAKVNKSRIARSMNQLVIKEELGDLLFNYGIWNADYPNEVTRKEFILDYDCYNKLGVDSKDIVNYTKEYNLYIEKLFEQSITENFRNKLNT